MGDTEEKGRKRKYAQKERGERREIKTHKERGMERGK